MPMMSWYEILEVPKSASTEEIRSAYLRMAREYHPDRVPEHLTKLRVDAEDKFKQIQQAWSVLGDPAKRRRYDFAGPVQDMPNRAPSPPTKPASHSEGIRDLLRRRPEAVKWTLLVLITTLVLVVIGEVVVARQSNAAPVATNSEAAQPVLVQVPADIREFKLPPRRIQTWQAAGKNGLEVQLLGIAARSNECELTFRIRAGDRRDLLLYEPPGGSGWIKSILGREVMVDRDLGELFLEDNSGAKYVSTCGLVGGQQTNFNLYNFTRRINFKPNQEVVLSAKFPPLSRAASSITFVSPALGKWQPEWRWPAITLK